MGESKSSAVIIDIFTMRSTAQIAAFLEEYKKVMNIFQGFWLSVLFYQLVVYNWSGLYCGIKPATIWTPRETLWSLSKSRPVLFDFQSRNGFFLSSEVNMFRVWSSSEA